MESYGIRVENITKIYDKNIVANKNISLQIKKGETFGIIGPNGAGKTTLIKMIVGLLKPDQGSIYMNGTKLTNKTVDDFKPYLSYMSQTSNVLNDLNVYEAVYYSAKLRGFGKKESIKMAKERLGYLKISQHSNKRVSQLSGGLLKLTSFAMATVHTPKVLIIDEPTNEVDPYHRNLIWNFVKEMKEKGTTIILITHNILEAEQVVSRVGYMNQGEFLYIGTPGELKKTFDDKIIFSIVLKEESPLALSDFQFVHQNHKEYKIYLNEEEAPIGKQIDHILNLVNREKIDDFKIATPSLEDIYMLIKEESENDNFGVSKKEMVS